MNSRITQIIPAVAGMLFLLFIALSVFAGDGNMLGNLGRYLLYLGFILGVFAPKTALYFVFICCAYLDLLKRLMIFDGRINVLDLGYVLGVAPVTTLGMCIGFLVAVGMGRLPIRKMDFYLIALVFAVNCVVVVSGMRGNMGPVNLLQYAANAGSYAAFIFLVPGLLKTREELFRFFRFLLFVFLPVAIYGIFQGINGLSDFEILYLKSGLTIEIKQLYDVRPRPFSTLNSAGVLGAVSAVLAMISLLPWMLRKRGKSGGVKFGISPSMGIIFHFIYLGSLISATSRAMWVLYLMAVVTYFAFRGAKMTTFTYAGGVLVYFTLLFSADYLIKSKILVKLDEDLSGLKNSAFSSQAFRMQTFTERLYGFRNLVQNKEMWTLFGQPDEKIDGSTDRDFYSHDTVGRYLLQYGAVPLFIAIFVIAFALFKIHRSVLAFARGPTRNVAACLLAVVFSVLVASALFGQLLIQYPTNAFFYMATGALILLVSEFRAEKTAEKRAAVAARKAKAPQPGFGGSGPAPQFSNR